MWLAPAAPTHPWHNCSRTRSLCTDSLSCVDLRHDKRNGVWQTSSNRLFPLAKTTARRRIESRCFGLFRAARLVRRKSGRLEGLRGAHPAKRERVRKRTSRNEVRRGHAANASRHARISRSRREIHRCGGDHGMGRIGRKARLAMASTGFDLLNEAVWRGAVSVLRLLDE